MKRIKRYLYRIFFLTLSMSSLALSPLASSQNSKIELECKVMVSGSHEKVTFDSTLSFYEVIEKKNLPDRKVVFKVLVYPRFRDGDDRVFYSSPFGVDDLVGFFESELTGRTGFVLVQAERISFNYSPLPPDKQNGKYHKQDAIEVSISRLTGEIDLLLTEHISLTSKADSVDGEWNQYTGSGKCTKVLTEKSLF